MNLLSAVKIFFIVIILCLFPISYISYQGNKIYYVIFTIISSYSLITSFNRNSISFETFFSLLFWLGFWFKFSVQISFFNNLFPEGVGLFNYEPKSFDQIMLICTVSLISYLFYTYLRNRYLFNYESIKYNSNISEQLKFYKSYKKQILFIYFFLILLIPILNLYFIFFQKGTIPVVILPFGLNNFINWLLMFGLASFSAVLIFFEFHIKKKNSNKIIKFSFLENFLSSISILSRAMIFNSTSISYGYYKMLEIQNIKINNYKFLKYFLIIILLFSISLIAVSKIRQSKDFPISHELHSYIPMIETKTEIKTIKFINDMSKEVNQIIFLISGRWVGIDGLMAVYGNKDVGFKEFILSFNQKFDYSNSFFENTVKKSKIIYEKKPEIYTVYTPGIVAFLYYTKSLIFLFFGILFFCICCSILELISFKISRGNFVFSYLIGNVLAYRLIHFGYMPQNTYKIIFAIIFNFIVIAIIFKIIEKMKL